MARGLVALLSVAAVVLFLGVLESAARLSARAGWISLPRPPTLANVLEDYGYLLDRELLFRRPPGYTGSTPPDVPFRINARGLRSPEVELAKPPGTWRTLVLGDSTAFGYGVVLEATFARRLERQLAEAWPGTAVQVINAGMLGYSIYNSLAYLRRDGLGFDPDLIVLQTNFNDRRYVPSRSRRDGRIEYSWLYLREQLRSALLHSLLYRAIDGMRASDQPAGADGEGSISVPLDALHSRVSPERFRGFLSELLDLARQRDIAVVLLGLRDATDELRRYDRALELAERGRALPAIALLRGLHPFLSIAAALRTNELLDQLESQKPRIPSVQINASRMHFDGSIPIQVADEYLEILESAGERDGVVSVRIPPARPDGGGIYLDFVHLNAAGHALAADLLLEAVTRSPEIRKPAGRVGDAGS